MFHTHAVHDWEINRAYLNMIYNVIWRSSFRTYGLFEPAAMLLKHLLSLQYITNRWFLHSLGKLSAVES
jgi:hypothetical protein